MNEKDFLEDIAYVIHLADLIDKMYEKNDRRTYQYLKRLRRIEYENAYYHVMNR